MAFGPVVKCESIKTYNAIHPKGAKQICKAPKHAKRAATSVCIVVLQTSDELVFLV